MDLVERHRGMHRRHAVDRVWDEHSSETCSLPSTQMKSSDNWVEIGRLAAYLSGRTDETTISVDAVPRSIFDWLPTALPHPVAFMA